MRLIKSKRGAVPDFVSDVFSFFLYLVFFLLFFLLFSISFSGCDKFETKNSQIIAGWNYKIGDGMLLQNYLRTQVEPDIPSATFSELIAESCAMGKFDTLIEKTKSLMNQGLSGLTTNSFEVFCDPTSKDGIEIYSTEVSASCPYRLQCTDETLSTIEVPLFYSSDGAANAILATKKCEYLGETSSGRPLTEKDKQKLAANLVRCVK